VTPGRLLFQNIHQRWQYHLSSSFFMIPWGDQSVHILDKEAATPADQVIPYDFQYMQTLTLLKNQANIRKKVRPLIAPHD